MCAGKLDEGCVGSDIGPSGSYLRSKLTAHGDYRRHRQRGGLPGPDRVASEPPEQEATCAGQSDAPEAADEPEQQSPSAVVLTPGEQQPFQTEAPRVVVDRHVPRRRVLRSVGEIRVEDDQKPDREAICEKVGPAACATAPPKLKPATMVSPSGCRLAISRATQRPISARLRSTSPVASSSGGSMTSNRIWLKARRKFARPTRLRECRE
jgi:hypothetical protein